MAARKKYTEQDYLKIAASLIQSRIDSAERRIKKALKEGGVEYAVAHQTWDPIIEHWYNVIEAVERAAAKEVN